MYKKNESVIFMSKKINRVPYQLSDTTKMKPLEISEIEVILRGADECIYMAGRAMLTKILKGSSDKKLLEKGLSSCPSYGYYKQLTIAKITKLVDWTIVNGYLCIEYNGKLPVIIFSSKGWTMYKPIYARELIDKIMQNNEENEELLINRLKNTNREVIIEIVEQIIISKNEEIVPFLLKWQKDEVNKVRVLIEQMILAIK